MRTVIELDWDNALKERKWPAEHKAIFAKEATLSLERMVQKEMGKKIFRFHRANYL